VAGGRTLYRWEWALDADPAALWPLVADTNRFNRDTGTPEIRDDGELVGGGYGVAVGGAFFTESQFSRETSTSKIGFAVLNWHLAHWGFTLDDGKWPTSPLLDMGFRTLPRAAFQARLATAAALPGKPGRWSVETDLKTVAAWQTGGDKGRPET